MCTAFLSLFIATPQCDLFVVQGKIGVKIWVPSVQIGTVIIQRMIVIADRRLAVRAHGDAFVVIEFGEWPIDIAVAFFVQADVEGNVLAGNDKLLVQPAYFVIFARLYCQTRARNRQAVARPAGTAVWSNGILWQHPEYMAGHTHHTQHDAGMLNLVGGIKEQWPYRAGPRLRSDAQQLAEPFTRYHLSVIIELHQIVAGGMTPTHIINLRIIKWLVMVYDRNLFVMFERG